MWTASWTASSPTTGRSRRTSDHEARLRALELGETPRQQRDEARLASLLESGRWPLPALGALTGLAGVVTGVVAR
ncbi:hypothetical protein [Streptomyces capoamus]|uniref:hypothetical protein n=1 Tax=Streptomyces capoamus TaxID=68183 RepID=UPI001676F579|nr:hypothetical protein [Streptomyces capoamus]